MKTVADQKELASFVEEEAPVEGLKADQNSKNFETVETIMPLTTAVQTVEELTEVSAPGETLSESQKAQLSEATEDFL